MTAGVCTDLLYSLLTVTSTDDAGAQPPLACDSVWEGGFAPKPVPSSKLRSGMVKHARRLGLYQLAMPGEGELVHLVLPSLTHYALQSALLLVLVVITT
jgi:hypothetical protein